MATAKQLAARKKFAAMARARAKNNKPKVRTVAKRRRKSTKGKKRRTNRGLSVGKTLLSLPLLGYVYDRFGIGNVVDTAMTGDMTATRRAMREGSQYAIDNTGEVIKEAGIYKIMEVGGKAIGNAVIPPALKKMSISGIPFVKKLRLW